MLFGTPPLLSLSLLMLMLELPRRWLFFMLFGTAPVLPLSLVMLMLELRRRWLLMLFGTPPVLPLLLARVMALRSDKACVVVDPRGYKAHGLLVCSTAN